MEVLTNVTSPENKAPVEDNAQESWLSQGSLGLVVFMKIYSVLVTFMAIFRAL